MLAIIGGSGIYHMDGLEILEQYQIDTPFGATSAKISRGVFSDKRGEKAHKKEVLFLPRHGENHQLIPSEVNYRANIWALKSLQATQIIGLSAVGSLRADIEPGDLALPSQYFDFVKGYREKSFFGKGMVAHVSTAEPSCPTLAKAIANSAISIEQQLHQNKTYACVDGPRLGTRAESLFLKNAANCDLVGMTNVPEAFLAREAQLCYCTIGIVTDFDCWQDDASQHVSVEQVISRYGQSLNKAKSLLTHFILTEEENGDSQCQCGCRSALSHALLTPKSALTSDAADLLALLSR
jgi:5'-methylthioadenosine phosphorylase